ncbi:hypothetical protein quinque_008831 [Culex quinquefasciatus]
MSPLLSSNKRQKGLNVSSNSIINAEYVIELEKIGHTEVEFASIMNGGYFYTHRSCASFSFGMVLGAATGTLSNLEVDSLVESLALVLPSPNESIHGGPSTASSSVATAEMMETDTDLLMPTPKSTPKPEKKIIPLALEGNHYVDGVCLSEHNLHQIKSLQAELASGNQSYSCNLSRHWTRTTEFWSRSNQP